MSAYKKALKKKKVGLNAGSSKAYKKVLTNTPQEGKADYKNEGGVHKFRQIHSVSADQVGGKGGRRYYVGEGGSRSMSLARSKASFDARNKMVSAPADSIPANLVPSYFDDKPKKKKKKKSFWKRK